MTVGPESRDQKEDRHSGKQESTGFEIIILIPEEEIHDHYCHIGEPEQIWYDEYFTERNIIVEGHMNDPVVTGDSPFQMAEPGQVYDSVNKQRNRMPVLLKDLDEGASFSCRVGLVQAGFLKFFLQFFHYDHSPFD